MSQSNVGMGYDCMDAGGRAMQERLPSDSLTQQIQEQSPKYSGGGEMSGYAALTRPTKPDELEFVGIPKDWCRAKLGDIADQITKGTTPTTAGFQYLNTGIPFIKIENINQYGIDLNSLSQFISEDAHKALLRSQFQEGDILFSIAGTIGKTALVTQAHIPANTNQAIAIIRGTARIFDVKFLRQQLRQSAETIAKSNARGGAMNNISLGDLKEVELSIPSLSEQQQIAAKLDELLEQVGTLKTRLDTIPKILKRFRQSVLAAAVSGKLTEDWRNENGAEEWRKLTFGDLVVNSANGISKRRGDQGRNTTVLRLANFKNAQRIFGNERKITLTEKELEKYCLKTGDLLAIRVNGSVELAGLFILYDGNEEEAYCDHFIRFFIDPDQACPKFIIFMTNEGEGRKYLKDSLSTSAGQNTINQKSINALPLMLPSLEEQTEIVRRVEQLFTYADQIEQRVKDAQARVNHLTQAILAKAFRGELTADWREQNPELISGENSAAALLERIKWNGAWRLRLTK